MSFRFIGGVTEEEEREVEYRDCIACIRGRYMDNLFVIVVCRFD